MVKAKLFSTMAMYIKEHGKMIWLMAMENWLLIKIKAFMKAILNNLRNKVKEKWMLIIGIKTLHIMDSGKMISFKARE